MLLKWRYVHELERHFDTQVLFYTRQCFSFYKKISNLVILYPCSYDNHSNKDPCLGDMDGGIWLLRCVTTSISVATRANSDAYLLVSNIFNLTLRELSTLS